MRYEYKEYLPMLDELYNDWLDHSYETDDADESTRYFHGCCAIGDVVQLIKKLEHME